MSDQTCKTCGNKDWEAVRTERKTHDWYTGELTERVMSTYRRCRSCSVIDKYRKTTLVPEEDGS